MEQLIESAADAIVVEDLQGKITHWNSGAERIYGFTAGEMVGKQSSSLVAPDGAQEAQRG